MARGAGMPRPPAGAARRRRGGGGRPCSRWARPRAASRARARSVAAASSSPSAREVASTSSSTVPATIVELDHCGTHAIVAGEGGGVEVGRARWPASGSRRPVGGAAGRAHRARHPRSVGGRKPARACSTVDLPDAARPDERGEGAGRRVERARAARRPGGSGACRRRAGWCARRRAGAGRRSRLSPGGGGVPAARPAARPGPGRRRPARAAPPPAPRCPWRAGARARREGLARPGRRRRRRPSAESTTSRSTRSTHGPRTCSTTTSVGEGRRAAGPRLGADAGRPRRR